MSRERPSDTEEQALRRMFGLSGFRPRQRTIVRAIMEGRDVLAVLPTGSGKSLCFQLPALMTPGLTLVVSPLISLMRDQVRSLRRRDLPGGSLNSDTSREEAHRVKRALAAGRLRLLYVSPERLQSPNFRRLLADHAPIRVIVDEAHCISEWGHDFRSAYRRIPEFVSAIGRPPISAFTATATPETRLDIEHCLALAAPLRVLAPSNRAGLRWEVARPISLRAAVEQTAACTRAVLRRDGEAAVIVYVPTRSRAVALAEHLRRLGLPAAAYHAGLDDEARRSVQQHFLAGPLRVVCATSAFGMGIDHPRIRLVCHVGIPGALESYVQEAGRAGRDGAPAVSLLLSMRADRRTQATLGVASAAGLVDEGTRRRVLRRSRHRLRRMLAYVRTRSCRRAFIASYFSEPPPRCTGCDRCSATGQR